MTNNSVNAQVTVTTTLTLEDGRKFENVWTSRAIVSDIEQQDNGLFGICYQDKSGSAFSFDNRRVDDHSPTEGTSYGTKGE